MATSPAPARTSTRAGRTRQIAEQLFRDHRPFLVAIAERNSAHATDAEEALQDAFLAFLDHFDPANDTPPLAWITLTLKRRCWAIYRRRRGAPDQPVMHLLSTVTDPAPTPDERTEVHEQMRRNRTLLKILKPNERRALGLLALGFSYREIMQATGWTYTKVNRSIRDGRKRLRHANHS
jgi:RNA polymerase sigma-70 factor (ECF subfamily)